MAENDVEPHTACKVPFALVQPTEQRKKTEKIFQMKRWKTIQAKQKLKRNDMCT